MRLEVLPLVMMCACASSIAPFEGQQTDPSFALPADDCLSADSLAVNFADVSAGCISPTRRVEVSNRCPRVLPLDVAASAPFTLIGGERTIAAGGRATFTLQVGPSARGRQLGTLTLRSLAQQISVGLTADVQPPPLVEDHFQLDAPVNELDMLLVLDDSATLEPIAEHVRAELSFFRLWLEGNGRQARFGVLNATRGTPRFATLATAGSVPWLVFPGASADEFERLTAFSFAGESGASCTEALLSAIDSGELARFRRPNLPLQVLCLTNQADAMEQPFLPALARVETELRRDLPRPTALKVDVVARFAPRDGLCGSTGTLDTGRYAALAETTLHGLRDEVCDHWRVYQGVTHQGLTMKSLALTGTPDFMRAPLAVKINGIDVPEGAGLWRYEVVRNAVVLFIFEETDVRISYASACSN
ncbi:MAG: hypothetical protein JNM17_08530 [Archangium sp.]|nr:hypothetical protein [Archangium sp.]